ncbi:SHOCT domain-containing protein [Natronobeatus ordinarius]|uniref:SHOCT domain-containing protein n=1 Tax=Natronobeatus ordinarius TaxID=2963433 RepID=UPI0020CC12AC|nr:SHOCT domain-containing protein [Natronobeatus ordinarius]
MTPNEDEDRTTLLIGLVSLGIGAAMIVLGQPAGPLSNLGVAILLLGWFVVTPLYHFRLSRNTDDTTDGPANEDDPLTVLKQRYAAGDLSETEFERKLEHLLGLEDVDLDDGAHDDSAVGHELEVD